MSHPVAGLPERVTIYEVGPRDGTMFGYFTGAAWKCRARMNN